MSEYIGPDDEAQLYYGLVNRVINGIDANGAPSFKTIREEVTAGYKEMRQGYVNENRAKIISALAVMHGFKSSGAEVPIFYSFSEDTYKDGSGLPPIERFRDHE